MQQFKYVAGFSKRLMRAQSAAFISASRKNEISVFQPSFFPESQTQKRLIHGSDTRRGSEKLEKLGYIFKQPIRHSSTLSSTSCLPEDQARRMRHHTNPHSLPESLRQSRKRSTLHSTDFHSCPSNSSSQSGRSPQPSLSKTTPSHHRFGNSFCLHLAPKTS